MERTTNHNTHINGKPKWIAVPLAITQMLKTKRATAGIPGYTFQKQREESIKSQTDRANLLIPNNSNYNNSTFIQGLYTVESIYNHAETHKDTTYIFGNCSLITRTADQLYTPL